MLSKLDLISRIVSKSQINVAIKSAFAAPAKVAGGQAVGKKRFRLPVEQDVSKLMANCCGANYRKDGEEIKLKDDSEYPEWLWKMPLKPRRLEEYDPATKEYWERAEVVGRQREYKLKSLAPKNVMIINNRMVKDMELKYRRRFRALAKYHYNAGYDIIEHHERDDVWNMHMKERYTLPNTPEKHFYPGIDKVNLPVSVSKQLRFRKYPKVGHFGL